MTDNVKSPLTASVQAGVGSNPPSPANLKRHGRESHDDDQYQIEVVRTGDESISSGSENVDYGVSYKKSISQETVLDAKGNKVPRILQTEVVSWHCHPETPKAKGTPRPFVPPNLDLRKIKVVSFDLDDTLWACEQVIEKAEAAMIKHLNQMGYSHVADELKQPKLGQHQNAVMNSHPQHRHDVTLVRKRVIQRAAETRGVNDSKVWESAFEQFYHARTFHVSEHLFPGAVDAVSRIKRLGLRIGTLTNGNADVYKVPELAHLVDYHVNPMIAGAAKPHRIPFDMLREKFNVAPDEILHVGDSLESDVRGALNADMRACWVTTDNHRKFDKDDVIRITHVSELADLFEECLQSSSTHDTS